MVDLYVVNGKAVGSDKFEYKLAWLDAVTRWVADELERHEHVVVQGLGCGRPARQHAADDVDRPVGTHGYDHHSQGLHRPVVEQQRAHRQAEPQDAETPDREGHEEPERLDRP